MRLSHQILAPLLLILLSGVLPAQDRSYVILTDLPKKDPYYKAVKKLASFHKASVETFDTGRMDEARLKLKSLNPRYVACVLHPDKIDTNLHREMLEISTRMDEDPFCDFAFGFITGADAKSALALVENSIKVSRTGLTKKEVRTGVITGHSSYTYDGKKTDYGFDLRYIFWACLENDPDVHDFVKEHFHKVQNNGVVSFSGCGDPEGIWLFSDNRNREKSKHWKFDPKKVGFNPNGEMPRITADYFKKIDLGAAVVWSGTCHSGVLRRAFIEGDIVSTFGVVDKVTEYFIPEGKSLALAILSAGPSAYLAPIGANHGYSCTIEKEIALSTGMPLGDVMRTRYNELVIAGKGRLKIGRYHPGEEDPVEYVMQGGGANRVLYGDPLFSPFKSTATHKDYLAKKSKPIKGKNGFTLICEVVDDMSGIFWDMYGENRTYSGRIYTTVDFDKKKGAVKEVTASAELADGQEVKITELFWALEMIDSKIVLHLQVNCKRGDLKKLGAKVKFNIITSK